MSKDSENKKAVFGRLIDKGIPASELMAVREHILEDQMIECRLRDHDLAWEETLEDELSSLKKDHSVTLAGLEKYKSLAQQSSALLVQRINEAKTLRYSLSEALSARQDYEYRCAEAVNDLTAAEQEIIELKEELEDKDILLARGASDFDIIVRERNIALQDVSLLKDEVSKKDEEIARLEREQKYSSEDIRVHTAMLSAAFGGYAAAEKIRGLEAIIDKNDRDIEELTNERDNALFKLDEANKHHALRSQGLLDYAIEVDNLRQRSETAEAAVNEVREIFDRASSLLERLDKLLPHNLRSVKSFYPDPEETIVGAISLISDVNQQAKAIVNTIPGSYLVGVNPENPNPAQVLRRWAKYVSDREAKLGCSCN